MFEFLTIVSKNALQIYLLLVLIQYFVKIKVMKIGIASNTINVVKWGIFLINTPNKQKASISLGNLFDNF